MESKSILVSFNERNKLITVKESACEYDWFMGEVKKVFYLESEFTVQKFEESWKEYIDVDCHTELCHRDRMRIVLSHSLPLCGEKSPVCFISRINL